MRLIHRGFTLIELLVVIAIIVALLAILVPSMSRAMVAAMDAQCSSKMRQTTLAILNYSSDNAGGVYTVMNGWQSPTLYDTDGGPAVGSPGIFHQRFVGGGYLPSMETWSCVFSEVPNIEDPRNTRSWTYGSFVYWPFNKVLTPGFGTGDSYPTRVSLASGSTPLVQDNVEDNTTYNYARGWLANHTTGNYWIWTAMNNVNPSNVNRRTDHVRDVRGGFIGTWDLSVTWYRISEMQIAMVDTLGRPMYSRWPGD